MKCADHAKLQNQLSPQVGGLVEQAATKVRDRALAGVSLVGEALLKIRVNQ